MTSSVVVPEKKKQKKRIKWAIWDLKRCLLVRKNDFTENLYKKSVIILKFINLKQVF